MRHTTMLVILLLTVLGCKGNEAATKKEGPSPEPLASIAGEYIGHNGEETLKLWIAKTGPFVAIGSVGTKQHVAKGNATLSGDKVTLTPTEFDGAPPSLEADKKPATLTLSPDGSLTSKDGIVLSKR